MSRAQCIIHRDVKLLMVRHRQHGEEWWCLPGGAIHGTESPQVAVLRELMEECCVEGEIIRQTSLIEEPDGERTYTFLVDIGNQEPQLGYDPEFGKDEQLLVDLKWLQLSEIPERDRAFLWASGLLSIEGFLEEVESWGESISYPRK